MTQGKKRKAQERKPPEKLQSRKGKTHIIHIAI